MSTGWLGLIGWFITRWNYASMVVGDTPRSQWLLAFRYGTLRKRS